MLTGKKNMNSIKELTRFGFLVGAIFAFLGGVFFLSGGIMWIAFAGIGAVLLVCAILLPSSLGLFYRVWMGMALAIGWVVSKIILALLYYLVVTPIALFARVSGKRFIDALDRDSMLESYWHNRSPRRSVGEAVVNYERQF